VKSLSKSNVFFYYYELYYLSVTTGWEHCSRNTILVLVVEWTCLHLLCEWISEKTDCNLVGYL